MASAQLTHLNNIDCIDPNQKLNFFSDDLLCTLRVVDVAVAFSCTVFRTLLNITQYAVPGALPPTAKCVYVCASFCVCLCMVLSVCARVCVCGFACAYVCVAVKDLVCVLCVL